MIPRRWWLNVLPVLFLIATFEHCYETLVLFDGGLNLPVVTTVLLVLAIDASIYFSMQVIELLPARIILALSGLISVTLNVKYMLDWKPFGIFPAVIAVLVGILIPLMLCLLGWLAKEVGKLETSGNTSLQEAITFYRRCFPKKSSREVAEVFGTSHTTVVKALNVNGAAGRK